MRKLSSFTPLWVVLVLASLFSSGCSREAKIARYLGNADEHRRLGRYDHAEIEYLNVLRSDQRNAGAAAGLGAIYFDQGRVARAFELLKLTRQLNPDDLESRRRLALILLGVGNLKEAREEAEYLLAHDPTNGYAPTILTQTAVDPESRQATESIFQSLPDSARNGAPVLTAQAILAMSGGDLPAAESLIHRAVSLAPESIATLGALAGVLQAKNDPDGAENVLQKAAAAAPDRSPAVLNLVRFKLQRGKVDEARQALKAVAEKTPDFLPALVLLAEIEARSQNLDEAARVVSIVLARDAWMPDARLLAARIDIARKKTDEAITRLEALIKDFPRFPQAHYQMALARLAREETNLAVTSLNQALAIDPDMADPAFMLATLNVRNGNPGAAIPILKNLIEKQPKLMQAQLLLVDAYRAQDRWDDAMGVLQNIETRFPNLPQGPFLVGILLAQQGRLADATAAFERALEHAPGFLPAVEQLVSLNLRAKRFDQAKQVVDAQIARAPESSPVWVLAAQVAFATGDANAAEAALKEALRLDPESRAAYISLAQLYVNTGQQDDALMSLRTVLDRNPKDAAALMLTASIHDVAGNVEGARSAYEQLLELNARNSIALNNLAYLYSEHLDDIGRAYDYAQKARELLPYDPHTADTLGWVLFKKGEYLRALGLLQESADKLPDSAEVSYHLGMALYMLGRENPARKAMQNADQLAQNFNGADDCRARLMVLNMETTMADEAMVATLDRYLAQNPNDPVATVRRAAVMERDGKVADAIALLERVAVSNRGNVGLLKALARMHLATGSTNKALEYANDARRLTPDDPEVSHLLGRLALGTRQFPWAYSLLQESSRKSPDDPSTLADFAVAAYAVGRVTEAESAMRRLLQTAPNSTEAGSARRFLEFVSEGSPTQDLDLQRVNDVLAEEKDFVPALMAKAQMSEKAGEAKAAIGLYDRILEIMPEFIPAMVRIVVLLASDPAATEKAYALATKARETLPDDAQLRRAYGIIMFNRGDSVRAESILAALVDRDPKDAEGTLYLGLAQAYGRNKAEAKETLHRALALGLTEAQQALAQKALSGLP